MSTELKAVAAAPGIAIAPVIHMRTAGEFVPTERLAPDRVDEECDRFLKAVERAEEALRALMAGFSKQLAKKEEGIFAAHLALLKDPGLLQEVQDRIRNRHVNAEVALQQVVARYEGIFESMDNPTLRQRAGDIRDLGRQVMNALLERSREEIVGMDRDHLLAVDEFLPSDIAQIDTNKVQGILMGEGGKYSHGAILARSLGIPCLVGLERHLARIQTGTQAILDGDAGKLILDPTEERIREYRRLIEKQKEAARRIFEVRLSPSVTTDGVRVRLYCNLESPMELEGLETELVDGVGLFRTEFAFMERKMFPSEQEQYELYRTVLETMEGKRVTFRTLDVGGDKPLPYLRTPVERNPVLGWRGIRLSLQWQDLFYTQIRALVRASVHGQASIMLPMVTNAEEMRVAREIMDRVVEDLIRKGEPVGSNLHFGVMVEIPAFAMLVPNVAHSLDFLSVGSNDLAQYFLGVDRDNPRVSKLYDPFHPGFLRFLGQIASQAAEAGIPTSLCGEIASEPLLIPVLVGMGFRRFSMSPVFLPRSKLAIRSTSLELGRELFTEVCALATAEEVRDHLRARIA